MSAIAETSSVTFSTACLHYYYPLTSEHEKYIPGDTTYKHPRRNIVHIAVHYQWLVAKMTSQSAIVVVRVLWSDEPSTRRSRSVLRQGHVVQVGLQERISPPRSVCSTVNRDPQNRRSAPAS